MLKTVSIRFVPAPEPDQTPSERAARLADAHDTDVLVTLENERFVVSGPPRAVTAYIAGMRDAERRSIDVRATVTREIAEEASIVVAQSADAEGWTPVFLMPQSDVFRLLTLLSEPDEPVSDEPDETTGELLDDLSRSLERVENVIREEYGRLQPHVLRAKRSVLDLVRYLP